MIRILLGLLGIVSIAGEPRAQAPGPQSSASTVETALRLADGGRLSEARAVIDSLVRVIPGDSPDLGDALFARATLAPTVLDANLDYEKIIRELPSSERREESLLRMAQRSLAAGDNTRAMEYLRTLARDYPSDSSQAAAGYWMARVLLEEHNTAAACTANRDAASRARAGGSSPALRNRIGALASAFCVSPAATTRLDSASKVTAAARRPVAGGGGVDSRKVYAVQVAAYAMRADAEAMALRLSKAGLDSHVDGATKPFRVRVGHYSTYAEAAAALQDLKTRKLSGFVSEIGR